MVNMSKIILTIISTLSIVTMLGAFFYSSIIGVLGLTSTAATVANASSFVKLAKNKLRTRVVKGAAKRSAAVAAQSYIPAVGGLLVGTAVVVFSADDYCETSNTMDNLIRNIEGKKEQEIDLTECKDLILKDVMGLAESTQVDFGEWANKTYENMKKKWLE